MESTKWQVFYSSYFLSASGCEDAQENILNEKTPDSSNYGAKLSQRTSSKIEGRILELIAEWERETAQAENFSRKHGLTILGDSLGVNIQLASDETEVDIQKLSQLGVRKFLRTGKWASGYVPIASIPELAEMDSIIYIGGQTQMTFN